MLKLLITFLLLSANIMAKNNQDISHLTELEIYVTKKNGTEPPFDNKYWNNYEDGIYVDIINGKPLFCSKDKFKSNTGWPSFSKTINDPLIEKQDNSHNMSRTEVRSASSDAHLGHVFNDGPIAAGGKRFCINSASLKFIAANDLVKEGYGAFINRFREEKAIAILAGGCFWGVEELFRKLQGVINVENGYSGGEIINPNYEIVKTGLSNHAEAVQITYDPNKISYEDILSFFFQIHDPTTLNQQGNDIGTQYRSAIFYSSEEEKNIAANLINKLNKANIYKSKIKTSLEEFSRFYLAEDYHQDYLERNPNGYNCHFIRDDWKL
jgi:peptide methionine sulfoxide reductase msrA/msrB